MRKINEKDFDRIKEELRAAIGTANFEEVEAKYCGPSKPIWYDEDTDEIKIASGWKIDEEGYLIHTSAEGPGVPDSGYVNSGPGAR